MLVSAVKSSARPRLCAAFHSKRFHIDDAGHGDVQTDGEARTIRIRFSSVPGSMLDAMHSLRAVEIRFGRLRDYRLLRDSEIPSEYQAICWASFQDPKSFLCIPPAGTTLKVELSPRLGRPEGGLGLADLTPVLVPDERRMSTDEPPRFVTLNIKRADEPIIFRNTARPPSRSRAMKAAIGHSFMEWGGFAPLEPLYASSPFTSSSQEHRPLDSKSMRIALNKWSQILGVADPLFPEMKYALNEAETRAKDADSEWEPLSEPLWMPDRDSDDVEMPRSAQESLKQSLESLLQRSSMTDRKKS